MGTVERILQPMPAASRRVFLKFFHHLPNIAGAVYTPAICAAGFSVPGIYGLNIRQAMNTMYPGWEIFGEANQNYVLEQIVEMSILQGNADMTLDDLMESRLGHISGSILGSNLMMKMMNRVAVLVMTMPTIFLVRNLQGKSLQIKS